jgi:tRNA-specific adenosine deaminase 3
MWSSRFCPSVSLDLATVRSILTSLLSLLSVVRSMVGEDLAKNLPHLRRCSKPTDLPPHLKTQYMNEANAGRTIHTGKSQDLYIMLGAEKDLEYEQLVAGLSTIEGIRDELFIGQIPIPLLTPVSQVQANMWSQQFWPTVYRKNNPLGPHPSSVARATAMVARDADIWMSLAHKVAEQAHAAGYGEPVGVVIIKRTTPVRVDPSQPDPAKADKKAPPKDKASENSTAGPGPARDTFAEVPAKKPGDREPLAAPQKEYTEIVALAGDARWHQQDKAAGTGNAMAHAALRAISMVAQKLVRAENRDPTAAKPIQEFEGFQDKPLLKDEELVFSADHPSPDGYLCHDLELYMTHEPCIMCSMAILHSRVGSIMFRHRMPLTGGMCAEDRCVESCDSNGPCRDDGSCGGGRAIGLHWRRELNWCMHGWEYSTDPSPDLHVDPHVHV